jgi:hypothetical protein
VTNVINTGNLLWEKIYLTSSPTSIAYAAVPPLTLKTAVRADYSAASLYPTPTTVWMISGFAGSISI